MAEKLEDKKEFSFPLKRIADLVENPEKYHGKFVATASFNDKKVIAYGKNPYRVYKTAEKRGYKNSVCFFVPDPKKLYISGREYTIKN